MPERVRVGVVEGVAVQDRARAEGAHGVDLDRRRRRRHDDHGVDAERAAGHRHALGVIAGRGGDDAARALGGVELAHAVVRAAHFEGERRLQPFALEQHRVAEPRRQPRQPLERRLDGDVRHARAQDAAQVLGGDAHGATHSAEGTKRNGV